MTRDEVAEVAAARTWRRPRRSTVMLGDAAKVEAPLGALGPVERTDVE